MNPYSNLHLGEKIYSIRTAMGLSQDNLAYALNTTKMSVSRLERGETQCSEATLVAIKKFLGIEKAPLLDHELQIYRSRIQVWQELIGVDRLDEARAMQSEMAVILNLPFEHDLYQLYLATECWLLNREYNFEDMAAKLSALEEILDNSSAEVLNIYHRCKGFLCMVQGEHKNSHTHLTKALAYAEACMKTDVAALFTLGQLYYTLGKIYQAIICFELVRAQSNDSLVHRRGMWLYQKLAGCYCVVRDYSKAEALFNAALAKARALNDEETIGDVLSNMGTLYVLMGQIDKGMAIIEQGLEYIASNTGMHVHTLLNKVDCLISINEHDKCREVLEHIKAMLDQGLQCDLSFMQGRAEFDTFIELAEHQLNLDDINSVKYIQDVAIPNFRASGSTLHTAILLCERLEAYYIKKRTKTKANAIAAVARDIYREMYEGEINF